MLNNSRTIYSIFLTESYVLRTGTLQQVSTRRLCKVKCFINIISFCFVNYHENLKVNNVDFIFVQKMFSLQSEPINPDKKRKLYHNYASCAVGLEFFSNINLFIQYVATCLCLGCTDFFILKIMQFYE